MDGDTAGSALVAVLANQVIMMAALDRLLVELTLSPSATKVREGLIQQGTVTREQLEGLAAEFPELAP